MALKYHPDKNQDNPEATAKVINNIIHVVSRLLIVSLNVFCGILYSVVCFFYNLNQRRPSHGGMKADEAEITIIAI